jgi:16S rRNA (guanine966-N2)-methyltransferase
MALRVIAGIAGGRRLVAPKGDTRPMTDRVKEALFASLGVRVEDAAVLDLYAGSGSLAIEALSRGARSAVLVDQAHQSLRAIHTNLTTTGFDEEARVVRRPVASYLHDPAQPGAPFDLVFLDPPYDDPSGEISRYLAALAEPGWLSTNAIVVVERRKSSEPLTFPDPWQIQTSRAYGDTLLLVAVA